MGVLWVVWPLDDQMCAWLDDLKIFYPKVPSRFPTGSEVKSVVNSLSGYNVEIFDNGVGASWQASIVHMMGGDNGAWTLLNINTYSGDNEPQRLWFEKGWESLITEILQKLTYACGPLVLFADTGDDPTVIAT
jgi:hypothetical protein